MKSGKPMSINDFTCLHRENSKIKRPRAALPSGREYALFDNLPKLMRPEQVAAYLDVSIKTIYDWRHRGYLRGVPTTLFLSHNRRLFIRTSVLLDWMASQNPGVEIRE